MMLHATIPLIGCAGNACLAMLVLFSNPRHKLNRVYALLGLCIACWNLGQFQLFVADSREQAVFWLHFEWIAIIFGPVLLYHLSLMIADIRADWRYLAPPYAVCSLFAALSFGDFLIAGARDLGVAGWYAVPGSGLFLFHPVFTALVTLSIVILWRRRRTATALHRKRLHAMIAAQMLLLFSGLNDVLPIFGQDTYPGTGIPVFPYGSVAAVFYGIIVGYSVLQNELLNVQLTLSRFAAQLVRFLFFFVIGVSLLLVASLLDPDVFSGTSFILSLGALAATGLLTSFLFPKLFGAGSEQLEMRLLGDQFEYHDKVRSFINSLRAYTSQDELLGDLSQLLTRSVGVASCSLYVYSPIKEGCELVLDSAGGTAEEGGRETEFKVDASLLAFFESSRSRSFLAGAIWPEAGTDEAVALLGELRKLRCNACFPLLAEGRFFGALMLGPKQGGGVFTATDIMLLENLAENLGLILNQFHLTRQIVKSQEMELLGRMSKGIAHDMNNLLTPISTLLQLLSEGKSPESLTELVQASRKNIDTVRNYVINSLFFSNEKRLLRRKHDICTTIGDAVALFDHKLAKAGMQVSVNCRAPQFAYYDDSLIRRLFANLLSNSIDASHPGASIVIEAGIRTLPRSGQNLVVARVIDHGEGIPRDVLDKIGTAYFTTKDTGDEMRGFGLGIPICHKIVQAHGGTLRIESAPGRGTTITIEFPADDPAGFEAPAAGAPEPATMETAR